DLASPPRPLGRTSARRALQRTARADRPRCVRGDRHGSRPGDDVAKRRNPEDDHDERATGKPAVVVERDGFNLHAGVRVERGDDMGRERLVRYGARPPLSLERLRRLPGGRVAYRLKYVTRGRGKFRVMTGLEFMARLAAIIAPPRYPLVRYAGVLGPRSAWRKSIVPKPRERRPACKGAVVDSPAVDASRRRAVSKEGHVLPTGPREAAEPAHQPGRGGEVLSFPPAVVARPGD